MEKKKIIFRVLALMQIILVLCASSGLVAYAAAAKEAPTPPPYFNINPEEVVEMQAEAEAMQAEAEAMQEGPPAQIILLDVRTEGEYSAGYIPGAVNIPLSELESRLDELDERKIYIVYCQSGDISRTASETLAQHGFFVYNMVGGINAWNEKFGTSSATPTAQTPASTLTPVVTPSPAVSPALTPSASPTPITSPVTTPMPEEEKRVPGFEAALAIMMLLYSVHVIKKRRR